jgi:hypothetical protein
MFCRCSPRTDVVLAMLVSLHATHMLNIACLAVSCILLWTTLTIYSPTLTFWNMSLLDFKPFHVFHEIGLTSVNTLWCKALLNTSLCWFTSPTFDKALWIVCAMDIIWCLDACIETWFLLVLCLQICKECFKAWC